MTKEEFREQCIKLGEELNFVLEKYPDIEVIIGMTQTDKEMSVFSNSCLSCLGNMMAAFILRNGITCDNRTGIAEVGMEHPQGKKVPIC